MKKTSLAVCALFLAAAWAAPVFSQEGPRPDVIYGDDDRLDLYQVKSEKLLSLADSTVGLFSANDVTLDESKTAKLRTTSYSQSYNLCEDEPFFAQRTGAFCSGSLVGPDLLMTAGHCITSDSSCKNTKFIFGFAVKEEGVLPETVAASDVYGCGKLIARAQENYGADWALIRLDRPVTGHEPLEVNHSGNIENGTPLVVIGHPAGLPTKVAGGGSVVRDASPNGYFVANLDTYGGNSGSAVFNAKSGVVEGILVRGETDYIYRGSCRVSNVCSATGCRGEDVTKMSALSDRIPAPGAYAPARIVSMSSPNKGFWDILKEARRVLPEDRAVDAGANP